MAGIQCTREEIVRRGQTLYDEPIRSQVEAAHKGKFLVLDVDTSDYEIDTNELNALHRARAKRSGAPLYLLRIGSPIGLVVQAPARVTLADGAEVDLDVFEAEVEWDGRYRVIPALVAEGGSLVGMSLLYGHRLVVDVVDGGDVLIHPLPGTAPLYP